MAARKYGEAEKLSPDETIRSQNPPTTAELVNLLLHDEKTSEADSTARTATLRPRGHYLLSEMQSWDKIFRQERAEHSGQDQR